MNQDTSPQNLGTLIQANFKQPATGNPQPATASKKVYSYPYLDKEGIKDTIQNARRFAEKYNLEQEKKSAWIKQMNADYRKEILENPHTSEEKILFEGFKKKYKLAKAEPMAYNSKVLEFNREHNTHFLLRSYKTLRTEIALTFAHLVNFYAAQIRDNNARKMNAGVTTAGTLPRMLTNSESLKRYKVDGVKQCPFQNDTILTHIHNLVEAGLLINYKSHGRNMGFSVDFNPEILAVQDYKKQKSQSPANQSFIKFKKEKHPYSDSITGTDKDKNEIKGDAEASPGERNAPIAIGTTSATRITNKNTQSEEIPAGSASAEQENSVKKSADRPQKQEQISPGRASTGSAQANSAVLQTRIMDLWQLCTELSLDMHVNHIPVDVKLLRKEAKNGTMSQQEFRILLFQEFLKYISRLKKGNQSAAGAFFRAFEELEDQKLVTMTGRLFTKEVMVDHFEKWLWMVDHAERWGKKRDWQFLYINEYLDVTRRDAKEVGFWYLEKAWNKNEKQKAKRKAKRAKKAAASQKRKKQIKAERVEKFGYRSVKPGTNSRSLSDFEKARKKVRAYLYGELPFEELHRYCRHNLSQQIVDGLHNLIASETEALRKYKA